MYAEGKLKGQNVSRSNKGINSFPDLKGSTFKPFRGLDSATIHDLLHRIFNKECSLKEAVSMCNDIKALQRIQSAFIKLTNSESWEHAVERYPTFTSAQKLEPFKTLNFTNPKAVPPQFFKYCQQAMVSQTVMSSNEVPEDGDDTFHTRHGNVGGTIWRMDALSITPENLKTSAVTSCHGFSLSIIDLANDHPSSLKKCDQTRVCIHMYIRFYTCNYIRT